MKNYGLGNTILWTGKTTSEIKLMATPSDSNSIPSFEPSSVPGLKPTELENSKPSYKLSVLPSLSPSNISSESPSSSVMSSFSPSTTSSNDVSLAPLSVPHTIENVALKKTTFQSSSAKSSSVSSKTVDGMSNNLSRTKWEQNPYWQVNLQVSYKIKNMKLHLNAKRLHKMKTPFGNI